VTPALTYRVAIHIRTTGDGAYVGTYDSLDRAKFDTPLALAFPEPSTSPWSNRLASRPVSIPGL
jgi:hypothetical protein